LDHRHQQYNESLAFIDQLEKDGKAVVIAPDAPLAVGRFEKNPDQLKAVWKIGYDDMKKKMRKVLKLSEKSNAEEA